MAHSKFDADYVPSKRPDLIASWVMNEALDLDSAMVAAKYQPMG